MKVGISFVDMEGAANNFEQEIASKNFGQVKQEATELWNKELNRVRYPVVRMMKKRYSILPCIIR